MKTLTKALAAVAFVGVLAIGTVPAAAQVYFDGPGFSVGVGPRWHHRYYYDDGPYIYHHRYWDGRYYDRY